MRKWIGTDPMAVTRPQLRLLHDCISSRSSAIVQQVLNHAL